MEYQKIFEKVKDLIFFSHEEEGYKAIETPSDEEAHFILRYEGSDIGELWLENGTWHFEYSDAYKQGSEVEPLTEFPDVERTYESDKLWPSFAFRIPTPNQLSAQQELKQEDIDLTNEVELLKRFGRRTADDPFLLDYAR